MVDHQGILIPGVLRFQEEEGVVALVASVDSRVRARELQIPTVAQGVLGVVAGSLEGTQDVLGVVAGDLEGDFENVGGGRA